MLPLAVVYELFLPRLQQQQLRRMADQDEAQVGAAAQAMYQAAQLAYQHREALGWARWAWQYSWVWLPLVVMLGGCVFRAVWTVAVFGLGMTCRRCNLVTFGIFVVVVLLLALLYLGTYPLLASL
jgi:hypothetical protein